MQYKKFHIIHRYAGFLQRLTDCMRNSAHCEFVNRRSFHLCEGILLCPHLMIEVVYRTVITFQCHTATSIRSLHHAQKLLSLCTDNSSSRTVTKKHAGTSVTPVHHFGKCFRTNNQCIFISSRFKISIRCRKCKQKPGASRTQIESSRVLSTDRCLYFTCQCREYVIRRYRRCNDQVKIID